MLHVAVFLTVVAAAAAQSCGVSTVDGACIQIRTDPNVFIVGGQIAEPHSIPWQVALINTPSQSVPDRSWCGASVLDPQTVLTAAHCGEGEGPGTFRVAVNRQLMLSDPDQIIYEVASVTMHEHYNSNTLVNDIALVRIAGMMTWTAGVQPVCMPSFPAANYYGLNACVSGWGTKTSGGVQSDDLRFANLDIITTVSCSNAMPGEVKPGMICAAKNGRDSCQGDSGGPLAVNEADSAWHQVGIVSWGYGCADPVYPGVYTEVYYFLDWIAANL